METIFVIYVLYASVVLIWSSLTQSREGLRHIIISPALLKEGGVLAADPIVIELRPALPGLRPGAGIPGALVVSSAELSSLVHWTPPGATLVFCEHGEGCHLDPKVEQTLLELGISAVYWLDLHTDYELTPARAESGALSVEL
jgi:hypothetical protein